MRAPSGQPGLLLRRRTQAAEPAGMVLRDASAGFRLLDPAGAEVASATLVACVLDALDAGIL